MIDPSEVSAVLVTRGNVSMDQIIESIQDAGITDIVVWNNAERPNLSCYGRYAGVVEAKNQMIYHQDDDLLAPIPELLASYHKRYDRHSIIANNRADEEWRLTAMGTLCHRDLIGCFDPYLRLYGFTHDFCRVSDVVFAYQHPYRRVVLGYQDLPWHSEPGSSMYLEEGHYAVRERARDRVLQLA